MSDEQHRVLLVWEGPAGSGKTTTEGKVYDHFAKMVPSPYKRNPLARSELPVFPRPRAYSGHDGVLLSQMKDYRTLLTLLEEGADNRFMMADRFLLSQCVYGALRSGQTNQGRWLHLVHHAAGLFTRMQADRAARLGDLPLPPITVSLYYIVFIPSEEVLNTFRLGASITGRQYPYHPLDELAQYVNFVGWMNHHMPIGPYPDPIKRMEVLPIYVRDIDRARYIHEEAIELVKVLLEREQNHGDITLF